MTAHTQEETMIHHETVCHVCERDQQTHWAEIELYPAPHSRTKGVRVCSAECGEIAAEHANGKLVGLREIPNQQ
jgi:hypothetical protein